MCMPIYPFELHTPKLGIFGLRLPRVVGIYVSGLTRVCSNLHPEMEAAAGILDFSTSIRTTLKILLMGDSVGIQLSQTLEEAMGA